MMAMSVSWSVTRVATQVHGMFQTTGGWTFLPQQRLIFVERILPCAPKPPQPSQASLSPFFIFQVVLKTLETTPAEVAHYPWDAEQGCCHGTAASSSFTAAPGGFHRSVPGQGLWIPHQGGPSWGPWGLHRGFQQPLPPGALVPLILASLCHWAMSSACHPLCSLPAECEGCPRRSTGQGCGFTLSLFPTPLPSAWLPPVLE